jgi:general secretion pathway protein D
MKKLSFCFLLTILLASVLYAQESGPMPPPSTEAPAPIPRPVPAPPSPLPPVSPSGFGAPIQAPPTTTVAGSDIKWTVTLTDTIIDNLVGTMSKRFGVNITVSKGVKGNKVSLALTNATLEQALDAITGPNGWKYMREDNNITIMTVPEYQEKQKELVITKTYQIQYTNAADVQNSIAALLSTAGKIARDDRTNQLFVTDTPESLAKIDAMIANIDIPVVTEVFAIKYADPDDVAKKLEGAKSPKGKIDVDARLNTIVVTDVESSVIKMRELVKQLDINTQLEVFYINYAKAEDVQNKIKDLLSKKGYSQVDKRNNRLIVDDIPSRIEKVKKVVAALDAPDKLVYIEAEIVDMDYTKSVSLGINWNYGLAFNISGTGGSTDSTGASSGSSPSSSFTIPLPGGSSWERQVRNFFNSNTSFLTGSLSATAKIPNASTGDTDILASPRILIKNDEKASIIIGGTLPYTTVVTQPATSTSTYSQYYSQVAQDYGVQLSVKPHINEDGVIDMEVRISNTSADSVTLEAGGTSYTGVKTTKSEADTKIQVRNNQTVVIGGLVTQSKNKSGSNVPILDKIPILGPMLFSSKETKHEKRNLLLFITPHIVNGTRDAMTAIHPEAYDMLMKAEAEPTVEGKPDLTSSDTTKITPVPNELPNVDTTK